MSALLRRSGAGAAVLVALLSLPGCSVLWKRVQSQGAPLAARAPAPAPVRVAQVSFGGKARFALCNAALCPSVTRKTLAREVVAPPAAEAVQIRLAPVELAGGDEHAVLAAAGKPHFIYFAANSARLSGSARSLIEQLLPDARSAGAVLIVGHTDSTGTAAANAKVAAARAAAVGAYLGQREPALGAKLRVLAEGACCYVGPNATSAGRSANRRVAVHFSSVAAASAGARAARAQ